MCLYVSPPLPLDSFISSLSRCGTLEEKQAQNLPIPSCGRFVTGFSWEEVEYSSLNLGSELGYVMSAGLAC